MQMRFSWAGCVDVDSVLFFDYLLPACACLLRWRSLRKFKALIPAEVHEVRGAIRPQPETSGRLQPLDCLCTFAMRRGLQSITNSTLLFYNSPLILPRLQYHDLAASTDHTF